MNQSNQDVWVFPCQMTFKVMTIAREGIEVDIISAVQRHCPGDYSPTIKPSRKGNYYSVSLVVHFDSKAQVDAVYQEVHQVDGVKMLL